MAATTGAIVSSAQMARFSWPGVVAFAIAAFVARAARDL